jgi:nucleoid DNA-binding protein
MAPKAPRALSKSALMSDLADKTGLTKKQVGEVLEALTAAIASELKSKKVFALPGLVKIKLVNQAAKPARMGRNPATGEQMMFKAKPAKSVVKVRALKALKDMA